MDDLLDVLYALRPLWLPSLVLSIAAGAGLALLAFVDRRHELGAMPSAGHA